MIPNWQRVRVEQIASARPNALSTGPFGSAISAQFFVDEGVPVIRGSNLSEEVGTRLKDEGLVFLTDEKAATFTRSEARRGDLVFTCWGTIGQVGLVDKRSRYERYIVSNKQMKLTPDRAKADSLYLYYAFSSPIVMASIQGQAIGSSVPGFNLGQLRSVELDLPPLPEQRRIAAILGALDDKIEVNRKMNRTLEEMAQALFKSWFIDFDGHDPKGLVDSELGPIPRDWKVTTVGDHVTLRRGTTYKSNLLGQPGPILLGLGSIQPGGGFRIDKLKTYGGESPASLLLYPGDIYGSLKGATKEGDMVGSVARVPSSVSVGRLTQDTVRLIVKEHGSSMGDFLYRLLRTPQCRAYCAGRATGSAQVGLSRTDFLGYRFAAPVAPGHIDAFVEIERAMSKRQEMNDGEARTLSDLRDTLLPKLISGEIRVPEAEDAVEAAL